MEFKDLELTKNRENRYSLITPISRYFVKYNPSDKTYYTYHHSIMEGEGGYLCALKDLENVTFMLNNKYKNDLRIAIKAMEDDILYFGESGENYIVAKGLLGDFWTEYNKETKTYDIIGDSDFINDDFYIIGVASLEKCKEIISDYYKKTKNSIYEDIENYKVK